MYNFPDTEKKLRSRISSYMSSLNKEKRSFGYINDSGGKRYLLFSLYFVLNDLKKSQEYFEWYKKEFSDDIGEPIQKLCWALSLHRLKHAIEAKQMLAETMLSNLYLIPRLLGQAVEEYDIWHSSNYENIAYIEYLPKEVRDSMNEFDFQWMNALYESFEFRRIRQRYIKIYHDLKNTKDIEKREHLLNESYSLLESLDKSNS